LRQGKKGERGEKREKKKEKRRGAGSRRIIVSKTKSAVYVNPPLNKKKKGRRGGGKGVERKKAPSTAVFPRYKGKKKGRGDERKRKMPKSVRSRMWPSRLSFY